MCGNAFALSARYDRRSSGGFPAIFQMSKKNKKYKQPPKETTIEDFYDLKSKEMDELVAALKGETPEDAPVPTANIQEITGEKDAGDKKGTREFDPYKRDKLSRIPFWIKALLIKFWFFGLVCYLVLMGLGSLFVTDDGAMSNGAMLDLLFLCGAVMGLFVECLVNPIFRMMESDRKEYNYFMMFPFPFKHIWTFITNILYYLIVVYCVGLAYAAIFGNSFGGVEPLLFGVVCLVVDMIFIGIKDLFVFLIKRAIRKSRERKLSKAGGV